MIIFLPKTTLDPLDLKMDLLNVFFFGIICSIIIREIQPVKRRGEKRRYFLAEASSKARVDL